MFVLPEVRTSTTSILQYSECNILLGYFVQRERGGKKRETCSFV